MCIRDRKYGFRFGDNSPKAIIELVDKDFNAKGQDSGPKLNKKVEDKEKKIEKKDPVKNKK